MRKVLQRVLLVVGLVTVNVLLVANLHASIDPAYICVGSSIDGYYCQNDSGGYPTCYEAMKHCP